MTKAVEVITPAPIAPVVIDPDAMRPAIAADVAPIAPAVMAPVVIDPDPITPVMAADAADSAPQVKAPVLKDVEVKAPVIPTTPVNPMDTADRVICAAGAESGPDNLMSVAVSS